MNEHNYCVIMAGGGGFRFWPLGRDSKPKQFLDVAGKGESLLRMNFERLAGIVPKENILVVTLSKYQSITKEILPDLDERNLLLEPYARHTAPCIAYATYTILKRDPQAVFVAIPSDILLGDEDNFESTIKDALDYASTHKALITLGIVPNRPDTNFGYIQVKGGKDSYLKNVPSKVKTFTEKPDENLAKVFVRSGEFLWNSGIFVWQAQVIRDEMEKHIPQITKLFKGWEDSLQTDGEPAFLERIYGDMDKISIDYGVMEKTDISWVYPTHFGWTDLNNWDSLQDFMPMDPSGNIIKADRTVCTESSDSIIVSQNKDKLVMIKGLNGCIVIDTPDVLMIYPKEDAALKMNKAILSQPEFEKFR